MDLAEVHNWEKPGWVGNIFRKLALWTRHLYVAYKLTLEKGVFFVSVHDRTEIAKVVKRLLQKMNFADV